MPRARPRSADLLCSAAGETTALSDLRIEARPSFTFAGRRHEQRIVRSFRPACTMRMRSRFDDCRVSNEETARLNNDNGKSAMPA